MKPELWEPPPPEYRPFNALLHRLESVMGDLQREQHRKEALTFSESPSKEVLGSVDHGIEFLTEQKQFLEALIEKHIEEYPTLKKDQALLESIPVIGLVVASWMNGVIQRNKFSSVKNLAALLGLTPKEHTSGSSVNKPAKLSKIGPSIYRKKLYMAATVAIRHNPDSEIYMNAC